MGRKKLDKIYGEIAHDLDIPKKLARTVIKSLFKELAISLLLKGKPIMIRRFMKIVIATRTAKRLAEDYSKYKTKMK